MSIGNWFKTNLQNSNFSKLFSSIGESAMKAGITSAAIRSMNNQNSIFGGGCNNRNWNYAQGNMNSFGGCCGFGNFTGYSQCGNIDYFAQLGINMSAEQGYLDGLAIRQQAEAQAKAQAQAKATQQQGQTPHLGKKTSYQAADRISSNQDKTAGEKLDQNTTQILNDKKGSTTIVSGLTANDADGNLEKYKKQISELAKSYGASMDTNGDGYVTLDEFIAKEKGEKAKIAFQKMDINGDGKLDWKELAATLSTIDQDTSGKKDGVISYSELKNWGDKMTNTQDSTFDTEVRKSYELFGINKKNSTQKTD